LDFLIDELYVHNPEKRDYVIVARAALRRLLEEMEKAKTIEEDKKQDAS